MRPTIKIQETIKPSDALIIIAGTKNSWKDFSFSSQELKYVEDSIKNKDKQIVINQYKRWVFICIPDKGKDKYQQIEDRKSVV